MTTGWVIYDNQPYYLFGTTLRFYRLMSINHRSIDVPRNELLKPYISPTYKIGQTIIYKDPDTLKYIIGVIIDIDQNDNYYTFELKLPNKTEIAREVHHRTMSFKAYTWVYYQNEPYYIHNISKSGIYTLVNPVNTIEVTDPSSFETCTLPIFNCGDTVIYTYNGGKRTIGTIIEYDKNDNFRPYKVITPGFSDWWVIASDIDKIDL